MKEEVAHVVVVVERRDCSGWTATLSLTVRKAGGAHGGETPEGLASATPVRAANHRPPTSPTTRSRQRPFEAFVSFWRATYTVTNNRCGSRRPCAFDQRQPPPPPVLPHTNDTSTYVNQPRLIFPKAKRDNQSNQNPTVDQLGYSFVRSSYAMAPKKTTSSSASSTSSSASSGFPANLATSTFNTMWNHYQKTTSHQTKLIDIFLLFLVVVGAVQFLYYLVLARDVRETPSCPPPS